jgi:ureidoacrylate peracid hydrolase
MMKDLISTAAPEESAVLIIDMQNDYVHRRGASLRYFRDRNDGREIAGDDEPSAAEQIVPCITEVVTEARLAGVPIIWVRTVNDENTASPKAVHQGKLFVWADNEWGTAFFSGLEPELGEPIVTKHRHSAFYGTNLDIVLGRLGIKTVILTGVSTPYCVEGTARDAFSRDYSVITLADGTASKVHAEHEAALSRLGRVFGQVCTTNKIISVWHNEAILESVLR